MKKIWFISLPTIVILLISLACNLNLGGLTNPETPPSHTPVTQQPLKVALITFHVQLPVETPPNEDIILNVLDEVTGLSFNAEQHSMQADGDLHYRVSLPLAVGTTVKYRYSRMGQYTAIEQTSDKRPVRYRLFHVDGPGEVFDVVSAWSDTVFSGPTGRIMGEALDANQKTGIPNLLVTAGGQYTFTNADGTFLLEGLPPGTHNLVTYATDGMYRTFQQGAVVAEGSTTPASLILTPAPLVNVIFTVSMPENTMPAVPIRLAGNLSQMGNTYADLSGGVSLVASRMPTLSPLPDGRYSLAMTLPVGADIAYKYTLGDGFWNAEHDLRGNFRIRHLVVPETAIVIEDRVEAWSVGEPNSILFEVDVPGNTPPNDYISIQFYPYGWTEPIPMWPLGENHWVYVLYSPLNVLERIGYRYCRNDQCNSADDSQTPGEDSYGRGLEITDSLQIIRDEVVEWMWLPVDQTTITFSTPEVRQRHPDFIAGIEFQPGFHPTWTSRMPAALTTVQDIGSNWVFFTPTWTFTRLFPPVLEQVSGEDPSWTDLNYALSVAKERGLKTAINPTPSFPGNPHDWWITAPRDFSWWVTWYDRYRTFLLHHVDLAERSGVEAFILGGDWVTPALPGGMLKDGSFSGSPPDAESRWRELIREIRQRYSGFLIWEMSFPEGLFDPPAFLDEFDAIYISWSAGLADRNNASDDELIERASNLLDDIVYPFYEQVEMPLILGISYPSVDGGATGCISELEEFIESTCLDPGLLSRPNPDIPTVDINLAEQAHAYNALLIAINDREWISGFVSRGFYPPANLLDKSNSVHGKPAADVLRYWYPRYLGMQNP